MSNDKYRGPCLYRGKRLDNGEWVEGYYIPMSSGAKHFIYLPLKYVNEHKRVEIDPQTLSAWTGLEDKNGVKIFGGDVLYVFISGLSYIDSYKAIVEVCHTNPSFLLRRTPERFGSDVEFDFSKCGITVFDKLGNIWDNPELLGGRDGE